MMPPIAALRAAIDAEADPAVAGQLARYLQAKPGGYGEGDHFVGVRLSRLRQLVRPWLHVPVAPIELTPLLAGEMHEYRLAGLIVLADYARHAYQHDEPELLQTLYALYCTTLAGVNNWDLVDCSAPDVVGGYLLDRDQSQRSVLRRWVASESVWERRVALVATYQFILAGQTADTYDLVARVLDDRHDLIHKAAGWMLREAGKRVDEGQLRAFLDTNAVRLPRTMLRYAIERLPVEVRREYLAMRPHR